MDIIQAVKDCGMVEGRLYNVHGLIVSYAKQLISFPRPKSWAMQRCYVLFLQRFQC